MIDLHSYDTYIVGFSGGKDSIACALDLLNNNIPKHKIKLFHHLVDGENDHFMDWECTEAYCQAFSAAMGIPVYFSYKKGGFRQEMLRNNQATGSMVFQVENGDIIETGGNGPLNTRLKFPQVGNDLRTRWCSGYLKIDVMAAVLRHDPLLQGKRILVLTGERGEESTARSKYKQFEPHRAHLPGKRHIDHYRPLLQWSEGRVWAIIKEYNIRVHPAYYLGYSRCSCKFCIFGNPDQFATSTFISPEISRQIQNYETDFGYTLKRSQKLSEYMAKGNIYPAAIEQPDLIRIARSTTYPLSIIMDKWELPAGAFGDSLGPT